MKRLTLFLLTLCNFLAATAQDSGFAFGRTTRDELDMTTYQKDTSAAAVVLREFGFAYIDSQDYHLVFEKHVKIKILKQAGLEQGNVELRLHRQEGKAETIESLEASSFNLDDGGRIVESKLQSSKIFRQEVSDYTVIHSFVIPNVKVGSVIEYKYIIDSPWLSDFQSWEFQSDIPKILSEFWAEIPAYYLYNITLTGYLKLSSQSAEAIRSSFSSGAGTVGVSRMKYSMNDVPAFVTERFMTAPSNYLSAIHFELLEVRYPDGRVNKVTAEWKDVVDELRRENRFGVQLKRAKNIIGKEIAMVIDSINDPLEKARVVYDYVVGHFEWNDVFGIYSEHGIRKAFDMGKGNVGDINLTLVAALIAADLTAEPVILSTRENGFPVEIHPVINDFNYVIARLVVGDKVYLLDATDDFMPFGLIPERCINGKGRVISENSQWIQLDAPASKKTVSLINMKIMPDGKTSGTLEINYYNYAAVEERKKMATLKDDHAYVLKKMDGTRLLGISNIVKTNTSEFAKPLTIKFDFEGDVSDPSSGPQFLINPFFFDTWKTNPFRAAERLYPVDFGIPIDERSIVYVELPEGYQINSISENVGLALPNAGGRFLFQTKFDGNKLSMSNNLVVSRTFYSAEEYHYLKELFSHVVQVQAGDVLIGRK